MQLACFVYIKRCWLLDKTVIENYAKYVSDLSYKHSLLVFPEGTDFTERTKESSDCYALKNGLQVRAFTEPQCSVKFCLSNAYSKSFRVLTVDVALYCVSWYRKKYFFRQQGFICMDGFFLINVLIPNLIL